jgi:UDPglucose 6-dehydrogenase/GDP-mannose 6-dehydrogenase
VDDRTRETLAALYASWPQAPKLLTNTRTAEMIKYASNSVLATMISFSNEIARLCTAVGGIDVVDVMHGVHQAAYFTSKLPDGREIRAPITSFLGAGCGFGGSCLPKDVSALVAQGERCGVPMQLLDSVLKINRGQPEELLKLLLKHFQSLAGVRIAVLGLAFKQDTDDVRESPAFPVLRLLKAAGARVSAYDPVARPQGREELKDVSLAASLADAISDAEAIVLITRWSEFARLPELLQASQRKPLVVDGRRMLDPGAFDRYEGIGRRVLSS